MAPNPLPVLLAFALATFAVGARADDPPPPYPDEPAHPADDVSIAFGLDLFRIDHDPEETRVRVLDLALLKVLEVTSRPTGFSHVEVLHAPLVVPFESMREPEFRRTRVLDVPLFTLWRSEEDLAEGRRETAFFELPILGALFRRSEDRGARGLDLLFFAHLRDTREATELRPDAPGPEPRSPETEAP